MSEIFNGEWWTVLLPTGWHAAPEEHGASFWRTPRLGTLHISSAKKSAGRVSDDDLKDFAAERLTAGHQLQRTESHAFSGFQCIRSDGTFHWNEWWLKDESLMIYANYVVPMDKTSGLEKQEVAAILESLAARYS